MTDIIKFDLISRCILGGMAAITLLIVYIKNKKGDNKDGRNRKEKRLNDPKTKLINRY